MAKKKKYLRKSKGPSAVLVLFIVAIIAAAAVFGYLFVQTRLDHDRILDNVTVAGVDVGGMTKKEAAQAIGSAAGNTYGQRALVFTIGEDEHQLPADICQQLDADAAAEHAYEYGRTGFLFRRYREQKKAGEGTVSVDITKLLNLNEDEIRKVTKELSAQYNTPMKPTEYEIEGSGNERVLVITVGQPGYVLDGDTLFKQLLKAYNENDFHMEAECQITATEEPDWERICADNCVLPENATMDPVTYKVTDEKDGFGFTPLDAKNATLNGEPGQLVRLPFQALKAEVTREDLEKDLFKDLLSEYTAKYGSSYNRDINLKLSTAAVNGKVLLPGEIFDYNSTLGERTPEAGYKLGNTYAGMETVQTYGGGICQTSSTLYYCALMADLEIVSRINHGFISDYVPYGMDATVSWGGPEFRFKNNTKYPIKIEAYSSGGNVTVKLWGTDDKDYYVKMEYEVLGTYGWKTVYEEMSPDNPKGYKDGQVITSPYTGYKVQTYRCKYSKATDELISREAEAYSVYDTRNKVVVKIVEKEPTVDPSVPTDPVTPPGGSVTPPDIVKPDE